MIQLRNSIICIVWIFIAVGDTWAQYPQYAVGEHPYDFVRYDLNRIYSPGDSTRLLGFFRKMDQLLFKGLGNINVVHLGGSHVQADIHSGRFRDKLVHMLPGLGGPRGFVFPFKMARTNSPSNYSVTYTGTWTACRSVQAAYCELGLSGVSVSTKDTLTEVSIDPNNRVEGWYDFNAIRIFHKTDSNSFSIESVSDLPYEIVENPELGYTEIRLSGYENIARFRIRKTKPNQNFFTLYGVQFVNNDPGFSYHSIGVNGAAVPNYLKCSLFTPHLKAIKPDLVILAIGVNDAHGSSFNKEQFKQNYRKLLQMIEEASPGCAVLFITNNDTYFRKRYINYNGGTVREAMFELGKENGMAVYDLFSIMGGYGSMATWQANGLAASDRIHFTGAGYKLVGDLMFESIISRYTSYLKQQ